MKMECPYVKSFCCLFSVRTGSLLIVFLNLAYSFFGFIAWVSTGVIIFVNTKNENIKQHDIARLVALHIALGTALCLIHLAMVVLLYKGLQKEDPKYVRWYLVLGTGVIFVNIGTATLAALFFTIITLIYPVAIGIPLQIYFLLVIRSGYKEMLPTDGDAVGEDRTDHERTLPAPLRTDRRIDYFQEEREFGCNK